MRIGVLGATGPAGRGIAARLALVGHDVVAGSRERSRAEAVVSDLRDAWGPAVESLTAGTNDDAAGADLVVLATKWDGAVRTAADHADSLAGKTLICMANGLTRSGKDFLPVLPGGASVSVGVQAAAPGARVVAAFQHVPAAALGDLSGPVIGDVVVCGDDDSARKAVIDLVAGIAELRGFDGGPLVNSLGIEAFAAVLLTCNVRHRGHGSLRLLGLDGIAR
jgi:NADPH-dependent F420 reductase